MHRTTPFLDESLDPAPMGNSPRKSSRKPKLGGKKSTGEGEAARDDMEREEGEKRDDMESEEGDKKDGFGRDEDVSTIEVCSLKDDQQDDILPLSCENDMNSISPSSSKEVTTTPPLILNHAPTSHKDDSFNFPSQLPEEGVGPAHQPHSPPLCASTPPGPTSMVVSSAVSTTTNSCNNGINQFLPGLLNGSKVNLCTLTTQGESSAQLVHSDTSAVNKNNGDSCQNSVASDKQSLDKCVKINDDLRKDNVNKESTSLGSCDKDCDHDDERSLSNVSQEGVDSLFINEQVKLIFFSFSFGTIAPTRN